MPSSTRIHLLLGGLGVGKTTALQSLLAQKPAHEVWGVVMNEFGPAGVDQWLLPQGEEYPSFTVSGGCICCSPGVSLVQTIQQMVATHHPHRLFIEPSGWAHPAELRAQLKKTTWNFPISLGAVLGLVDLGDWSTGRWLEHQSFWDMIHASDILLATKPDLVDEDTLEDWYQWAEEIYPPKIRWEVVRNKQYSLDWLGEEQPLISQWGVMDPMATPTPNANALGRRIRQVPGGWSASWVFAGDHRFDPDVLTAFLAERTGATRIKGIFQLPGRALVWQWVRGQSSQEWVTYDRDSRLEVLALETLDWDEWEQGLKKCFIG